MISSAYAINTIVSNDAKMLNTIESNSTLIKLKPYKNKCSNNTIINLMICQKK